MPARGRKGQSVDYMGLSSSPNTESGLMPSQWGKIGTEEHPNGTWDGVGGQDPSKYRNHQYGKCPAVEVGHTGLSFKLCGFR